MNYFEDLYSVDVSGFTEKKNNLTYLSWPWAWAELKKKHPFAEYKIYETPAGVNYFTDGRTCWVKVSVTVCVKNGDESESLEHIEMLPVMDFKNRSIPIEAVTSMDVCRSIQRALTKAVARHGLGLWIYAGEDVPVDVRVSCADCGTVIPDFRGVAGAVIAQRTNAKYGRCLCMSCVDKMKEATPDAT